MIGIKQNILDQIVGYSGGVIRDAAGTPLYLTIASTRHAGWSAEWTIGTAAGLSCDSTTYALLHGATAITSPTYLAGCFVSVTGAAHQLVVDAGAALPGDVPPPPPPP